MSLGWMHASRLAPSCASSKALQLLADTRTYHSHQYKDVSTSTHLLLETRDKTHPAGVSRLDARGSPGSVVRVQQGAAAVQGQHLTYAYRYGTFEKLVELGNWSRRIEACAWGATAGRERALLALLAGPAQPLHAPPALHTAPTDNRDLNVILSYEPPEFQDPQLKTRTFDQDLADLRAAEAKRPQFLELQTCVEAFSDAMRQCAQRYGAAERVAACVPFPSRIIAFVTSQVPYRELYTTTLLMVGSYCVGEHTMAHQLCDSATVLVSSAKALVPTVNGIWDMRERLEDLANYLEALVPTVNGIWDMRERLEDLANYLEKKVSKSPDEMKSMEMLTKLNSTVQHNIASLEAVFENLPQYTSEVVENEFSKLDISEKFVNPVEGKLNQGRLDMIADVKNVLRNKAKYLKSLIQ
ncbi:Phagocyte signaling-impaired protein [Operophtera brumata]|uniref:Phagocyte signaling-impaired protein n=1 Tax=Operophtera brumata TaxID=104452 RepID=A0A0L7KWY2_OPEBR|nr:Phagocyte signaling-impaired protein [Operophtera brumata]